MNRDEILLRAQSIVESRRQKAITIAEQKRDEIYKNAPMLQRLENERLAAGVQMGRLALSGGAASEMEDLRHKMDELEAKKKEILSQYEVCEPQFTCKKCNDTGRVNGMVCSCVADIMRTMRLDEATKTSPLELCSFDKFDLNKYPDVYSEQLGTSMRAHMTEVYNFCVAYAENFDTDTSESLYLCGYAGLGKTHLALSIAREAIEKGFDVVYVSAQDAFANIEKEKFGSGGETMQTMLSADLLILDDLGTEFITPFIGTCLYGIINTRANKKKPTIYTSNIISDADLARRYTEKIVSRLLGSCEVLYFCGNDIRIMKNQEER